MKTTKKDFKIFKEECEKWIKIFNLGSWDIKFFHDYLTDGMYAGTTGYYSAKNAEISLNKVISDDYTGAKTLKEVAFHEVCELLLMELRVLAQCRFIMESDIDHAVHGVIQRLLNGVYRGKS